MELTPARGHRRNVTSQPENVKGLPNGYLAGLDAEALLDLGTEPVVAQRRASL